MLRRRTSEELFARKMNESRQEEGSSIVYYRTFGEAVKERREKEEIEGRQGKSVCRPTLKARQEAKEWLGREGKGPKEGPEYNRDAKEKEKE